jgi:Vacuolar-sorting-associated 13 protein C-terminal
MPFMFKNIDILSPIRMIFIIFGNVGNVFLEFEPLRFYQRHLTMPIIKREISSFYIGQCKNQVINILASSDAIGNPNELIRNLRSGVVDLITLSGELSITGLFKGMKSFFRHSIFGASNSMSKLFESFKKGMYTIYLDESKERGVLSNLLMASTRTALLLPNIVIAMASSTANHIRDAVQQQHYLLRKRPPRSFLSSRVLSVYSYSESVGQYVLSMVDHGRYLSEGIKYHVSLKDSVIVVTSKRVLCAVVEEYKPNWEIKILSITITKLVNETLQIYYVKDDSPGFLQEKVQIIGLNEELEKLKQVIISLQT